MKASSKIWSRAVALMVAGMLVTTKACADGSWSQRTLLNKGDAGVLIAPEAWFDCEIKRVKVAPLPFTAKLAGGSYAQEAAEAELNDLRAALRKSKTPNDEIEQLANAHAAQRANLSGHGEGQPEVVAGLPDEFADYFRGSIAWRRGDVTAASQEWETLLKRPPAQRQYKSVWAAYMLGQAHSATDPQRAAEYFKQTRSLVSAGFSDSTGLAVSSIGLEALTHLLQGRLAKAIDLYLAQAAAGDDSGVRSLRMVASDALGDSRTHAALAAQPQARRVITAYAVSARGARWSEPSVNSTKGPVAKWLDAVEAAEVEDPDEAELLALAAYRVEQFDGAKRWIKRAKATPVTQWLEAKLHVRAGRITQAMTLLAKAAGGFPSGGASSVESQIEPAHDTLAQNIFIPSGAWNEIHPARHIAGELGVLRLHRRDYVGALDDLLRGGFWTDAAYVAERVLTVDELKAYVDREWPETHPGPKASSTAPTDARAQIRHLLARRLVRASLPARAYFSDDLPAKYDQLMSALKRGETESLSPEDRSAGWWEGAKLIREHGMELLGTELEPDWRTGYSYYYRYPLTVDLRATNENAKVLVASADELRRARSHNADPEERYHYRFQAAFIALQAASLLPDNSEQKAGILCTAGTWIKYLDPAAADIFYKHLVRRCRQTALGAAADIKRWFPAQDSNGDFHVSTPEPEIIETTAEEPPTVIIVN